VIRCRIQAGFFGIWNRESKDWVVRGDYTKAAARLGIKKQRRIEQEGQVRGDCDYSGRDGKEEKAPVNEGEATTGRERSREG